MDLEAVIAGARGVLPTYFGSTARRLDELRPTPDDFARVFARPFVDVAIEAYAALWTAAPTLPIPPTDTVPLLDIALSDDFVNGGPRSRRFPNGYRSIAERFHAGVPWLVLRFVQPDKPTGLMFDGFVALDRRYVWFPKPWKTIARTVTSDWYHWVD